MKEVLITSPDVVAHFGSQFIGPLPHSIECGGGSKLLDPFVGQVDR
jgi:hypothetical protein